MSDQAVAATHQGILEARGFAHIATIGSQGTPQVSPTWYLWDGDRGQLLISLTTDRQKYRNLKRHPHVAVSIPDPDNPYRYIEMRGPVTIEVDEENRLIDALTRKYIGKDKYTRHRPGDVRVVVQITPRRVLCVDAG